MELNVSLERIDSLKGDSGIGNMPKDETLTALWAY